MQSVSLYNKTLTNKNRCRSCKGYLLVTRAKFLFFFFFFFYLFCMHMLKYFYHSCLFSCFLKFLVKGQTVKTLIRLLFQEQSDLGLHCLQMPFCQTIWWTNLPYLLSWTLFSSQHLQYLPTYTIDDITIKIVNQKAGIFFLISPQKGMLWVFISSASVRCF